MSDHIEFYKKKHECRFAVDQENQVNLRLLSFG
jgi:hypothetical protein